MIRVYLLTILFLLFLNIGCTAKIKKTGITDTNRFSTSLEGLSKDEIINIIGHPSSIDPIDNSLIYFNEIKEEKNIFDNKIISRDIYVITFNENGIFEKIDHFVMDDKKNIKFTKKTTEETILKTGLIERVFGGVGQKQTLPGGIPRTSTGN